MFFLINLGFAQDIEIEKTYTISKDAKKGFLGDVQYNEQTGSYLLSYVTKSKKTFAQFENYTFDKDFNFVNMEKEEIEFGKAKNKYNWWNYKGEDYSIEMIYADDNSSGDLILRKVRLDYNWNWFWGDYSKPSLKKLEKVKLRSDDGDKYYYYASHSDEETNELFVLCGLKSKSDKENYRKNLHIIKINFQLDVVKDYAVSFPNPAIFNYFGAITDDKKINELFVILNTGTDYTYIRLDSKLDQKDKISFNANAAWKIDNFFVTDNQFYFYGPSGKEFYTLVKIDNGKLGYANDINIDEFQHKLKNPPSQRRTPEYRGKKFVLDAHLLTRDGELFITGQNWATKFNALENQNRDVFTDVLTFYFDVNGKLKAQYGVDPIERNEQVKLYGNEQSLYEGKDDIYWLLAEVPNYRNDYPSIMKINKKTTEITDPVIFGKEKYFLEPRFPILDIKGQNKIVFFGADKKGNTLWFCKVRLD